MGSATADKPTGSSITISAADMEAHEEKMALKRSQREKMLPEHIRCLDAEHAGNLEAQKPRFRYAISCTVQEHDPKLKRMVAVEKSGEVDAQNEDDAWAKFCDRFKVRTGPKHCNRVIKKLSKQSVRE